MGLAAGWPVRTGTESAVVGTDRDRLEGSAGEGGKSSGVTGNGGALGGGVRGRTRRVHGRNRGGGAPGSERVQWIWVERVGGRVNLDFHWAGSNVEYNT